MPQLKSLADAPVSRRAQRADAKRQVILRAAKAVFLKSGFGGATMDAVAERAGMSRGAQLHHYGSRERLIAGAVEYLADRRLSEIRRKAALLRRTRPFLVERCSC